MFISILTAEPNTCLSKAFLRCTGKKEVAFYHEEAAMWINEKKLLASGTFSEWKYDFEDIHEYGTISCSLG